MFSVYVMSASVSSLAMLGNDFWRLSNPAVDAKKEGFLKKPGTV
jgi:hypothetical protein